MKSWMFANSGRGAWADRRWLLAWRLLLLSGVGSAQDAAERYVVDAAQSDVHWLVYKAGALARLGHNHTIAVGDLSGDVAVNRDDLAKSLFDLRFSVADLVVDDPALRSTLGEEFASVPTAEDIAGTRTQHVERPRARRREASGDPHHRRGSGGRRWQARARGQGRDARPHHRSQGSDRSDDRGRSSCAHAASSSSTTPISACSPSASWQVRCKSAKSCRSPTTSRRDAQLAEPGDAIRRGT